MDRVTVRHGGRTFEAKIARSDDASPTADATPAPVWQVTEGGHTVTTFPAGDSESADAIREKIVEWLRANEDRPETDVGRQ